MNVFIAGPRVIKELDENIITKLKKICEKNYDVLVGDADGIDSNIQIFFKEKNYKNVTVYASRGIARNNYGDWKIKSVKVEKNITGFDFYAKKDLEMAKDADIGFMIWNGKSRGTFSNIINLLNLNKKVILYYFPTKKFYQFNEMDQFEIFIRTNVKLDYKLKKVLPKKESRQFIQACLF